MGDGGAVTKSRIPRLIEYCFLVAVLGCAPAQPPPPPAIVKVPTPVPPAPSPQPPTPAAATPDDAEFRAALVKAQKDLERDILTCRLPSSKSPAEGVIELQCHYRPRKGHPSANAEYTARITAPNVAAFLLDGEVSWSVENLGLANGDLSGSYQFEPFSLSAAPAFSTGQFQGANSDSAIILRPPTEIDYHGGMLGALVPDTPGSNFGALLGGLALGAYGGIPDTAVSLTLVRVDKSDRPCPIDTRSVAGASYKPCPKKNN